MTREIAAVFFQTFPYAFLIIVWLTPDRSWRRLSVGLLIEWAWVIWFGPWNFILPAAIQNFLLAITTTLWVAIKARRHAAQRRAAKPQFFDR